MSAITLRRLVESERVSATDERDFSERLIEIVDSYIREHVQSLLPFSDTEGLVEFLISCIDLDRIGECQPEYVFKSIMGRFDIPSGAMMINIMGIVVVGFNRNLYRAKYDIYLDPDKPDTIGL